MYSAFSHFKRHPKDLPFITALAVVLMLVPVIVFTVAAQTVPVITVAPTVPESVITENTVLITWRTDVASTSVVEWGETTSLEGIPQKKIVPIQETEVFEVAHTISLWGLSPGMTYHYRVRSVSESGGQTVSAIGSFTTAAPPFTGTPLRSVSLTSPTAGLSSDGVIAVRVSIDGAAESVQASIIPVAGGESIRLQLAEGSDGTWFSGAITLTSGEWLITATAVGFNTTGGDISLESGLVSVAVLLPAPEQVVEDKPEPTEEVESEPEASEGQEPEPVLYDEPESMEEIEQVVEEIPEQPIEGDEPESAEERELKVEQSGDERVATLEIAPTSEEVRAGASSVPVTLIIRDYDKTAEPDRVEVSETLIASVSTFVGAVHEATDTQGVVEVTKEVKERADAVIEEALREEVFVALPVVMPVTARAARKAKLWVSETAEDETRSKAVIVIDSDLDGLPDDYELAIGLDPDNDDSDGDGIGDAEELQQGSDPLGEGSLDRELSPTEETIVFHRPLAQPALADEIAEEFHVFVDRTDDADGAREDGGGSISLGGRCDPNTTCILYVYSYIPVVLTMTTTEDGSWSYDLAENVVSGEHTVYVAVTDDTGKIERRSDPFSFIIPEARAITVDDVLDDIASPANAFTEGSPEDVQSRYLFGTGLVIVGGIVAAALVLLRPKKKREKRDEKDKE